MGHRGLSRFGQSTTLPDRLTVHSEREVQQGDVGLSGCGQRACAGRPLLSDWAQLATPQRRFESPTVDRSGGEVMGTSKNKPEQCSSGSAMRYLKEMSRLPMSRRSRHSCCSFGRFFEGTVLYFLPANYRHLLHANRGGHGKQQLRSRLWLLLIREWRIGSRPTSDNKLRESEYYPSDSQ